MTSATGEQHVNIERRIREILRRNTAMPDVMGIDRDEDLLAAGLSSLETVTVILSIEKEWAIRFDEATLSRHMFTSLETLCAAVNERINLDLS
ncbi:phosphopantetheine-binding protein [Streptomyces fildesensis]|uniref:phosphopantetheine-binding protein n=1 Tax=Streptomyces fildesensis TaxID=375757 RepID=UPI0018DF5E1D|nr:phosphopantetheine-binding protein [Streptomyces fildesensis]